MPSTVEATTGSGDSSVMPVVLREEMRPPQYGIRMTEGASRSFYTKYLEYKRRVERANLGGTVQYPIVSMAQLINTPLQKAFARRYFSEGSITPLQLEEAIRKHAGDDEDLSLIHI